MKTALLLGEILNLFRYLECCFAKGKSSVTVICKSMNLNAHMDGIIQWGASAPKIQCTFFLCLGAPKKC